MNIRIASVLWLLLYTAASQALLSAEQAPNILIIISDDQGYEDFGFTGNTLANTPVLDRLARESAFYPHCMVAPACSPTRSALLTGRDHLNVGVWGVGPRGEVRRDEVLMPSFFKASGYASWMFGKWDGAKMMELGPVERGFDWFCGIGGGYKQQRPLLCTPEGGAWTDGWSAELITDAAIEKIQARGDRPWLAYMAYIIPHMPWECPDAYAQPYRDAGHSESFAQCYGSIKQMDDQIGRLLQAVEDAGQSERTIVIFLSDNGPTEDRPAWVNDQFKHAQDSSDWALRNPSGFVGHKAEVWENGIRSPLLIKWPGKIAAGERAHVAAVEDILPTLLDLAAIPPSKQAQHLPFDGRSLRPSLEDATYTDERVIFRLALAGPGAPAPTTRTNIIEDAAAVDYTRLHTVVRQGPYKFHHLPGGDVRLYNIERDPSEQQDLTASLPELSHTLRQRCRAEWDRRVQIDRTFEMRQLKIDNRDRWSKAWTLHANRALAFEGKLYSEFYGGAKGFQSPGDRAEYRIEVQKPVRVHISASGKGLDGCAPIHLMIAGHALKPLQQSAKSIEYGAYDLPSGFVDVSLTVPDTARRAPSMGEVLSLKFKRINEL